MSVFTGLPHLYAAGILRSPLAWSAWTVRDTVRIKAGLLTASAFPVAVSIAIQGLIFGNLCAENPSSTAVIGLVFAPIYALASAPMGFLVGYAVPSLPAGVASVLAWLVAKFQRARVGGRAS